MKSLAYIVLVGGKSSRMGRDKSALSFSMPSHATNTLPSSMEERLNARDFLWTSLLTLKELKEYNGGNFTSLYVSCREEQEEMFKQRLGDFPCPCAYIYDKGLGVMEAIVECLETTKKDCLFIPCDVPCMTVEILQKLVDAWTMDKENVLEEKPVVYSYANKRTGRRESLISLYTQQALPYLKNALMENFSLQKAFPQEVVQCFFYDEEAYFFDNLNSPHDYEKLKEKLISLS